MLRRLGLEEGEFQTSMGHMHGKAWSQREGMGTGDKERKEGRARQWGREQEEERKRKQKEKREGKEKERPEGLSRWLGG